MLRKAAPVARKLPLLRLGDPVSTQTAAQVLVPTSPAKSQEELAVGGDMCCSGFLSAGLLTVFSGPRTAVQGHKVQGELMLTQWEPEQPVERNPESVACARRWVGSLLWTRADLSLRVLSAWSPPWQDLEPDGQPRLTLSLLPNPIVLTPGWLTSP
ncbi:hypothetical protein E5288_WYG011051 [Bos mutus]|uniref:Uncharacterized protein n=1 Tax=Bos mutus TaxID=72004 RepID=A0A6B0QYS5_9CETA|nr:hypothetical protein [Bos mutus]